MKNSKTLLGIYTFTFLFICLPFVSFVTRGNFLAVSTLDTQMILSSLRVSLTTSVISMIVVVVLGIPAGYFMARGHFRGKGVLDALFNLPQVLPPAVIGLLLLLTFGNQGFVGRYLVAQGIRVSFSTLAVVVTFIFVSLPVFIKSVSLTFSEINPELEETAMFLGYTPRRAFWRVTYPVAKRGIVVALMLAWSRGISEFGATMMFAGNLRGVTQTLPLAIYSALETNVNNGLFLAFIMFIISLVVLLLTQWMMREKVSYVSISAKQTVKSLHED